MRELGKSRLTFLISVTLVGAFLVLSPQLTAPSTSDRMTVATYTQDKFGGASDQARFRGTFSVHSGCVVFDTGTAVGVPVFAAKSPQLREIRLGVPVVITGAEMTSDQINAQIPQGCSHLERVWIVAKAEY